MIVFSFRIALRVNVLTLLLGDSNCVLARPIQAVGWGKCYTRGDQGEKVPPFLYPLFKRNKKKYYRAMHIQLISFDNAVDQPAKPTFRSRYAHGT